MSVKMEKSMNEDVPAMETYIKRKMMSIQNGDVKKPKLDNECNSKSASNFESENENFVNKEPSDNCYNNNHPMTVNLNTINEGERTEVKSENFSATTSQSQASTTLPVSNVVHVRNLPNDLTDLELINFAIQFGELTNYLVLVGKGQAFLEFTTLEAAKNAIDNASSTPPLVLKGRQLYFQYSKHSRLQTNLPNQQMVRNVTGIIENGGSFTTPILPNSSNLAAQVKMEDVQGAKDAKDGNMKDSKGANDRSNVPGPVLRVIVENLIMVVPLMTFHELFSRYGNVTKIVMFQRTRSQALIQFDQISSATVAKNALNGQQMFAGGNVLRIDYSMMQNLCVKFNNEKSRDFTTPSLPISSQSHSSLAALATNDSSALQCYNLTNSMSYNGLSQISGVHPQVGAISLYQSGYIGNSPVLLVTGLPEQLSTPDALFTLFGVYGDVQRVKILYNKPDTALVQMSDANQAQMVIHFLAKLRIFGGQMKINFSKYNSVQMPKEGLPDSGLTKDYKNSPLHRFKKPGSKNYNNIFPPSCTLHLSNIPASYSQELLRGAFESVANVTIVRFSFFPKDQKMALIQLASIESAILALIKMHNYQLSESNHLRVSFSRLSI